MQSGTLGRVADSALVVSYCPIAGPSSGLGSPLPGSLCYAMEKVGTPSPNFGYESPYVPGPISSALVSRFITFSSPNLISGTRGFVCLSAAPMS